MASRDYEELLAAFNARGVRYLVVGAHAVAFHARPRATRDLDVLLDPAPANAERALAALREFLGGADLGLSARDLSDPRCIVQIGVAPVRVDLLATLRGIEDFHRVWDRRVQGKFGAADAHYISLEDLIVVKQAAGRPQDRADLRVLKLAWKRKAAGPKRRTR